MQSVGFKEWALVCEALGRGEQTILLRKGGIAEGRGGFGFRHSEFFLFPTFFHEQDVSVRSKASEVSPASTGQIEIRYFAKLEDEKQITNWATVATLEPFHILQESVVRERFEYQGAGLHVALIRVFRVTPVWILANKPAYGGCRSWVELPECPVGIRFEPVLSGQQHAEIAKTFRTVVP